MQPAGRNHSSSSSSSSRIRIYKGNYLLMVIKNIIIVLYGVVASDTILAIISISAIGVSPCPC
jgi:hypothetical protein